MPKSKEKDTLEATTDAPTPNAEVAYYYLSSENPEGASYPGVPLCDLTQEVVDAQPKWIQKSLKASKMYRPAYTLTGEGGEE